MTSKNEWRHFFSKLRDSGFYWPRMRICHLGRGTFLDRLDINAHPFPFAMYPCVTKFQLSYVHVNKCPSLPSSLSRESCELPFHALVDRELFFLRVQIIGGHHHGNVLRLESATRRSTIFWSRFYNPRPTQVHCRNQRETKGPCSIASW